LAGSWDALEVFREHTGLPGTPPASALCLVFALLRAAVVKGHDKTTQASPFSGAWKEAGMTTTPWPPSWSPVIKSSSFGHRAGTSGLDCGKLWREGRALAHWGDQPITPWCLRSRPKLKQAPQLPVVINSHVQINARRQQAGMTSCRPDLS
jgi:hypothetical protein